MKKLILLSFLLIGLMTFNAKAQNATTTATYTWVGANLQDNFSFYIDHDGYLHYSLIDIGYENNYDNEQYESFVYIYSYGNANFSEVNDYHWGGGSTSGVIYIGAIDQSITILHGAGYLNGTNAYTTEGWDLDVTF